MHIRPSNLHIASPCPHSMFFLIPIRIARSSRQTQTSTHTTYQAGWLGKGKDSHTAQAKEHTSRPLSSLKDPDAFGPPPKNVNYHGGAAVPNAITPDRRGLGAPVRTEVLPEQRQQQEQQQQGVQRPKPPTVPYRANTTGLNTNNLPTPPVRRVGEESGQNTPSSATATKPKPSLPPRLPPRQNSHPSENAPEPPPSYTAATQQPPAQDSYVNQGALGRLGKAGVSVPSLGIGSGSQTSTKSAQSANPWRDQPTTTASPTTASPTNTQASLSNLGSRFSKPSTASPPPTSPSGPAPSQGTSLQQKQDALRTASMFRNDPSSVSLSDARGAASTANNFRERHGEQVAASGRWAGAMNKKYDIANKMNSYSDGGSATAQAQGQGQTQGDTAQEASPWANEPSQGVSSPPSTGLAKRTPPPPPPAARKPGVSSPPPVPLGSKPRS